MDERRRILLGNKDILSRKIKDFYLDINLSRDNKEIIPYKYDNVFDLTRFYDQERNQSRNFIIYGIIDSCSWDCDNLLIQVYQSPDLDTPNYLCSTVTKNVVNQAMPFKNIFNKLRGRYIIDNIPTTFTGCSVYLKVNVPGYTYITEQQLIFTTLTLSSTGEKVIEQLKYGIDEAITDCDGNVIPITNDFDFFYNKHWIKKDIFATDYRTIWVGNPEDFLCIQDQYGYNTGMAHYNSVIELYAINHYPTGNMQNNAPPYDVADFENLGACPLPIPTEQLTIIQSPSNGGTFIINPEKLNLLYLPIDNVHISATANSCFNFSAFTYSDGTIIPHNVTDNGIDVLMNSAQTISVIYNYKKYTLRVRFTYTVETSPYDSYDLNEFPLDINTSQSPVRINGILTANNVDLIFNCGDVVYISHFLNTIFSQSLGRFWLGDVVFEGNSHSPNDFDFIINSDSTLEIVYVAYYHHQ